MANDAISMYSASVPVFKRMLGNLASILDKAAASAKARNFEPANLMQARLYPDMFALTKQVQVACDAAKACVARLAGVDNPKHEDTEATIDDLKARIAKTLAFIDSVPRDKIEGTETKTVAIPLRTRTLEMQGLPYLLHFAMPNFYFHLTTAYALLRHSGVEIGKMDYLGPN